MAIVFEDMCPACFIVNIPSPPIPSTHCSKSTPSSFALHILHPANWWYHTITSTLHPASNTSLLLFPLIMTPTRNSNAQRHHLQATLLSSLIAIVMVVVAIVHSTITSQQAKPVFPRPRLPGQRLGIPSVRLRPRRIVVCVICTLHTQIP